ncbi:MAG: methyltransferase domain-containing protein [Rhodothermales bacterium]
MPSFTERLHAEEMMDDFSIVDERLEEALKNLRSVNRWLGGYAASMAAMLPLLRETTERPLRVLDLATGAADFPDYLVRWADRHARAVEVVALDANPATVAYARQTLDRRLPEHLRPHVRVEVGDALALPYSDGAFDVCVASLFLHHLDREQAVALVREMNRVARHGLVINDLHRHPLAYYSILALARLLPVSPMFRNDGPISVLRGFKLNELHSIATDAGLRAVRVRWHWAFRWTLSTIDPHGWSHDV